MPWQIIAIIIVAVVLYVLADAAFDVSHRISSWWKAKVKPALARLGTRARDAVTKTHPTQSTWDGEAPAKRSFDWLGFLWKAKFAILGLVIFVVVAGAMRDWTGGRARLERDIARGETQTQVTVNERDAVIHELQAEVRLMRQDLHNISQRGRNALVAAAPANEAPIDPGLVSVWRSTLNELCVPTADGSRADTCGP